MSQHRPRTKVVVDVTGLNLHWLTDRYADRPENPSKPLQQLAIRVANAIKEQL